MADENLDLPPVEDVTTPVMMTTSAPSVTSTGTPTTTAAPAIGDVSTFDLIKNVLSSSPAKGAALGALMSNILGQMSEPGGVVQPLDMSQYGIKPRTTTITPPRFVPYAQYGQGYGGMSPEMAQRFGAVSGLGSLVPASALSATPLFRQAEQPFMLTSPGAGAQLAPALNLTPRGTNQISPLTGALLGTAVGYLLPSGTSGTGTGGTTTGGTTGGGGIMSGSALEELFKRAYGGVKNFFTRPEQGAYQGQELPVSIDGGPTGLPSDWDYEPDIVYEPDTGPADTYYGGGGGYDTGFGGGSSDSSSTVDDYYINPSPDYIDYASPSDFSGDFLAKDGGMATPLMADGGEVSYYTYGTMVDPRQVMQQMAQGGRPQSGLHVPVVGGRHDYREGSRVSGHGDGQSDDIPAMLADGEYVFDADTVAQLGNGSTKAGSDLLDKFREEIRSHKRSAPVNKIPPPSKSPLTYLKAAQARSKKNG